MKTIKPEDFPIEMNKENINILAHMMIAMPPCMEWKQISKLITYGERCLIRDRIKKIQEEQEQERWDSLTPEEQEEEKRKIEKSLQEGPEVFRGNILQQEWDSMELSKIEKEKQKDNNFK